MSMPIRINCGAPEPLELAGERWLADPGEGTPWSREGGQGCVREADLPLLPTTLGELLRWECFGLQRYRLQLPAGRYAVTLIVGESHESLGTAQRRYSLHINDSLIDAAMCPAAIAGGHARAGRRCIDGIAHPGGELSIAFGDGACVSGLMIEHSQVSDLRIIDTALEQSPVPAFPLPRRPGAHAIDCFCIGHSGFFFHAIPESLAALIHAERSDIDLLVDGAYHGGKGLAFLLEAESVAAGLARPHDLVLVTDGSLPAVQQPEAFLADMPRMIERVRASGALPVLYAYQGSTRNSHADRVGVMERYLQVGREHGAAVIPCAAAYNRCREQYPSLNLNNPDGHHLGMFGAWLFLACCHRVLTGRSLVGHPQPAVMAGQVPLPRDIADRLAALADEVCDELGCTQSLIDDIIGAPT